MINRKTFSFQLTKNFLLSTLIPFLFITYMVVHVFTRVYNRDVRSLLNSTVDSMISNIVTYLDEAGQVTMQPYYSDELYWYLKGLSDGKSYDALDRISLQNNLNSTMSFVRYTRPDVNGIFIVNEEKCLYYTVTETDRRTLVPSYAYGEQSWYRKAVEMDGRCLLVGPHAPGYIVPYNQVISLVRSIVEIQTRRPLYVIKVDVNTSMFDRLFKEFSFHVDSRTIIRDENRRIIYMNRAIDPEEQELLSGTESGEGIISLKEGKFQMYTYPIPGYPWTISILLSRRELEQKTRLIYLAAILTYPLGILLASVFYRLASQKMIASIDGIKRIFLAIQNEDFSLKYEYVSGTELDDLGESLNQMASQLEKRIQTEYVMQIRQKDIEFRMLQSQIKPHFLFNTLNNFIALNQIGDRETLENALYQLSQMLRYLLKAPALISLEEELAFIKDYCALQKMRFGRRMTYRIEAEPGTGAVTIPKLLIQPIVENSIIHGIEPCNRPCTVSVAVRFAEDGIVIEVRDDGIGCDTALCMENGIGLTNVRERLQAFSPQSRFSMESEPGKGTCTELFLYLGGAHENFDRG